MFIYYVWVKKAGSVTPGNALIREVGKRVH